MKRAILGYDLLNEPISPYSDVDYLNPQLEPLYRDIVTAIRSVDPNHVVLLGGGQWDTNFAVFDRPFDGNAIYTYHKFWVNPTPRRLQEYLNFSNRWNVPVLIGETGEFNNGWNDKFRRLHERFGIGWIFWPYKNLDFRSFGGLDCKAGGWDLIANAGSADDAVLPPRQQAQAILDAYLEAAKFKNVRVNDVPRFARSHRAVDGGSLDVTQAVRVSGLMLMGRVMTQTHDHSSSRPVTATTAGSTMACASFRAINSIPTCRQRRAWTARRRSISPASARRNCGPAR